jgi:hypothetical protein
MKKEKQYQIFSMEQLGEVVTEENIDILCENLKRALGFFVAAKKMNVNFEGFTWIDDGKTDIKGVVIRRRWRLWK